jgi:hypothetical protein
LAVQDGIGPCLPVEYRFREEVIHSRREESLHDRRLVTLRRLPKIGIQEKDNILSL